MKIKSNLNLAAFSAVFGIGYMGYMLLPTLLSSVIERFGINEAQAGVAATFQLGGLALALFVSTALLGKIKARIFCISGALLTVIGHLIAASSNGYEVLLAGLALGGIGMGAAMAGGDAYVSSSNQPDRLFAIIFAVGQLSAIVLLAGVLPHLISQFGFKGGFGAVALWTSLMAIILFFSAPDSTTEEQQVKVQQASISIIWQPAALALLMLGLADASVWPFSQQIGTSLGLGPGTAESVLAGALAAGVAGSLLSAWVGTRFGRVLPMSFGIIILACCYYMVLNAPVASVYATAQILVVFVYGFSVPYFFGLCGVLDPSGRLMATAAGMQMIGLALAPWLAGALIVSTGYPALGSGVVAAVLAALGLGLLAVQMLKNKFVNTG